jgi:hypothetical protein
MRVTQIFLLFFRNSFFFIYLYYDLEGSCSNGTKTWHVNVVVACGTYRVTRSDIGLLDLKHLRKVIIERILRLLRRSQARVVALLPCFRGWVCEVKYCWNRCSSILAF